MKTLKSIFALVSLICLVSCSSSKQTTVLDDDYKLTTVEYQAEDNSIEDLLNSYSDKSKFKKGQSLKESTFIQERERIAKLIRENKDPNFSIDQVSFEVDTTSTKNKFSVTAVVKE
ncbi:hypothetical protein [Aureitalea marina]|uniref:DUF4136 domain-containing protein n=1 Tax=Aureitalea marina TaxID=930804 RepID=A0A2S7KNX8_9FLAO|nr:hypothetical protein [Aureitalea marina]PQB04334.1 hypothetical protein BST85_05040 [Aureitalea marina]